MRLCLLLIGVLVLTGCNKPQSDKTALADSSRQDSTIDSLSMTDQRDSTRSAPDTLQQLEPVDSLEPPETQTTILPPEPEPDPNEPEHESTSGELAGSCDVRSTEQFCFAYTGRGWAPDEAQEHCGQAPESDFESTSCPMDRRIATCVFRREDEPDRELTYTYYDPYDPALAEIACPGEFQLVE